MVFKCGIIGLPNVGKSSLFNTLTCSSVKSENFPFCTIQSNKSFMPILDIRLYKLMKLNQVNHIFYGNIQLIDIAGLIKGASRGEGLGNKFLKDISEVDLLIHVVRCFDTSNVYHIYDEINPKKDIKVIHDELIISDINFCENTIHYLKKDIKYDHRHIERILIFLEKILIYLYRGVMLNSITFNTEEKTIIKNYNFLTSKPIIYIANINTKNKNNYLSELSSIAVNENIPYMSMCILSEEINIKINIHNLISKMLYFNNFSDYSKIFEITNIIYQILKLKTFFTINTQSVRSWIVSHDTVAIQAANMVHSDFQKFFIRVQVIKYSDFVFFKGWKGSKKFGKVKIEGKNYLFHDGDILNFLI